MAYINATAQVEIPPERTRDGGMPAVHMAAPRPMAASQPAVSLPHKWRHYSRGRDDIAENTDAEVVQSRGRRCGRRMEQVLDITHRSSKCIGRDAREGLTLDIRTGPAGVRLDMGSTCGQDHLELPWRSERGADRANLILDSHPRI